VWLDRGVTRRIERGFAHFEEWRDQLLAEEEREQHKLDRKIAAEEDWMRYGVTARRKRNMRRVGELATLREQRRSHRGVAGEANLAAASAAPSGVLVIEAEQISKTYGDRPIVSDFSIRIQRGDRIGVVGPNGAGKTTLIRMLLGLIAVSSGDVELLGGPPDREHRRRLGYVPQGLGLYGDLTVRENLSFSARAYGSAEPALPPALTGHATTLVRDLPLGAQRQVAFLAALAHAPEVLVLDEPTSGVDALARADLWDTIRAQAERGAGVLVTTHYMQEAQQCDRLLLMSNGRLVAQGTEADIIGATTAVAVRTSDWARAFAALNAAGAPVMLAGRAIRVANADPAELHEVLATAGIEASLQRVPATIEERMLVLARGTDAA
jgi:ABC-type multidrug transport system ATPase subunit